jgi:hypothetical protein
MRKGTGRPLPFCTHEPEALFRAAGWTRTSVVQPGQPTANFGRLTQPPQKAEAGLQNTLRTHLVTASL